MYLQAGDNPEKSENPDSQALDDDLEVVADVDLQGQGQGQTKGHEEIPSLDQAILQSVEACGSDDLKRKMFSTVLLVGGGAKLKGLDKYLQSKLAIQVIAQMTSDKMCVSIYFIYTNRFFTPSIRL